MKGRGPSGPAAGGGSVPPLFDPPRREPAGSGTPAHGRATRGKTPGAGPPPFEEPPIESPSYGPSPQETLAAEPMRPSEWFTAPLEEAGPDWWRAVLRWGAILLLAFFAIVLILAWSVIQVTGEETGQRIIQRSLLPITEIDDVLDMEYATLVTEARLNPDPATTMFVPSYPIRIPITAQALATMSQEELRAFLLRESTKRMYEQGVSAFQRETTRFSGGLLGARGVLRLTVGQITRDSHQIAQILGGLLLAATAVLVGAVMLLSDGFRRIRNVGFAVAIGTVPMTLAVVGARFALRSAGDDAADPFDAALFAIASDVMWIPIRNFIIFGMLGLLVVGLGIALGLWREHVDRTNWQPEPREGRQGNSL